MNIALLIGINYKGTSSELNGCINDVVNTKQVLMEQYHFEEKNISMLTDDTEKKPTSRNIIQGLYHLAFQTYKEDIKQVWISYSGHGSYITDYSSDEDDGKDECLVPLDYSTAGLITDDSLHHILGNFNPKTKVLFIIDACHSETILDLPYRYVAGSKNVIENHSSQLKGQIVMLSGCRDDQTSADAYNIENSHQYSGAMTSALLSTLKKFHYTVRCWSLLKEMRLFLASRDYSQVPQLSCTFPLDDNCIFSMVKTPVVCVSSV